MTDLLLYGAAGFAGLWFLVHLFAGGRFIARPLLAATALKPVVRDTQYLCWHFTSVSIAAMAAFFVLAAVAANPAFAVCGVILSAGTAVTGIALTPLMGQSYAETPQGWLFVPVAGLGLAGLLL